MNYRVGAVSYLNTKPLIYGLEQRLPGWELTLDLPSRLATGLASGDLDVALIPSVEFLRGERLSIVSDACIACRGPVRSVRLLFRRSPDRVETLALDEGSRTSAALAQVLLSQQYGVRPELRALPIGALPADVEADALLMIGDRAMRVDEGDYVTTWDLGEQWQLATGLPFVFAMWVAKSNVETEAMSRALQESRDEGLAHVADIAAREASRYGLSEADCRFYFQRQLHFCLGPDELAGLDLFRLQAAELGLVPADCTQLTLIPL